VRAGDVDGATFRAVDGLAAAGLPGSGERPGTRGLGTAGGAVRTEAAGAGLPARNVSNAAMPKATAKELSNNLLDTWFVSLQWVQIY
jgi:hypothetical protein